MKNDDVFFSLVILCYRAEESILPFVKRVHSIMSLYNFNWEIVLVANYLPNSTDKTPSIVKKLSDEYPHIRCVSEEKQGMMGWDLRKGLHSTRGQYIAMIDGDGQFPVESIFACFARMLMDDVDLVKTFRVFRYDGFYRTVISRGYNLIFRILFGKHFKDVNSKPKIIKRSAYEQLDLKSADWFIDAEIMIRAKELKLKVAEIPILFYAQEGRSSFIKWSAILEFTKNLHFAFKKHRLANKD